MKPRPLNGTTDGAIAIMSNKWVNESIWISKVKVIYWPWPKVTQIQHFKLLFLGKPKADWSQISNPRDEGTKICSNGPGHMTKMPALHIYGKNIKNQLIWNQKADDLESWYAASGTQLLPSLFKWYPWVDVDIFYGKVKFGPLCFCMG